MQTTMASSICPLCKNPAGADANSNPVPSRLCDPCRAMLSTILPQAVAGSVVIVDAQKPASQAPVTQLENAFGETSQQTFASASAIEVEAMGQDADPALEPTRQPNAPVNMDFTSLASPSTPATEPVYLHTEEEFEPTPTQTEEASQGFFIQAEEKFEDPDVQAADKVENSFFQAEEKFANPYTHAEQEVENHYLQAEEKSPYSFREPAFVEPPPSHATYVEQREKEHEKLPQGEGFFVAPTTSTFVVQENLHAQEAAPLYPQEAAPQHFYPQEVAPPSPQKPTYQISRPVIEDVPPSWDDTPDNYPVLMLQEERRSRVKPLMLIAVLALIAVVSLGYWFVYKPYFGGAAPNTTQRTGTNVEDHSQPPPPDKTAENSSPAAQTKTPANAASSPTTQAASEDTPTTPDQTTNSLEEQNGQGKYSLQAASFPSEQAAREFSEKLIRSGVPTYIAAANIAGKGKWFRVRIGRFANPADAEKYATQAKQRSKATGLNLELVVCDYTNQ